MDYFVRLYWPIFNHFIQDVTILSQKMLDFSRITCNYEKDETE